MKSLTVKEGGACERRRVTVAVERWADAPRERVALQVDGLSEMTFSRREAKRLAEWILVYVDEAEEPTP